MNLISLLFFLPLCVLPSQTPEDGIHGTVSTVFDGNTLEVATEQNEHYRVVLAGIDCPELTQAYGTEARNVLEDCVLHQKVVLFIHGKDRLKNYIGIVLLRDQEDARVMLLTKGLAWTSETDPDPRLESIRSEAAANRKGLWKGGPADAAVDLPTATINAETKVQVMVLTLSRNNSRILSTKIRRMNNFVPTALVLRSCMLA